MMLVGVPGHKNGIDPFLIGTPEVTVKKFAQFVDEEKYELRSSSRYSLENGNELGSRPQIGGRCGDSADGIANRVCNPKPMQPARELCGAFRAHPRVLISDVGFPFGVVFSGLVRRAGVCV